MRLSEYASTQRTYGSRKVPRSVQQSIPIDRIYEDGTWRCGNVYSQMWSIFYGRNAITGNLIVGDRTKLINGNAMVIATSGSGKSMSVKMEIIMEFLRWPNARFILVDPENEYELLVKALGGEAIKVSVDSRTHFNPLDYHYDPKTDVPPDVAKIEFVLSMLDKLIGENGHAGDDQPPQGRHGGNMDLL